MEGCPRRCRLRSTIASDLKRYACQAWVQELTIRPTLAGCQMWILLTCGDGGKRQRCAPTKATDSKTEGHNLTADYRRLPQTRRRSGSGGGRTVMLVCLMTKLPSRSFTGQSSASLLAPFEKRLMLAGFAYAMPCFTARQRSPALLQSPTAATSSPGSRTCCLLSRCCCARPTRRQELNSHTDLLCISTSDRTAILQR